MRIEYVFPPARLLPGAVFHSHQNPHILFVVEDVARHAQDCSCPMVSFRSITPTRDAPAGTLWTLDQTIFRKRMVALSDSRKDALWDGYSELLDEAAGLLARRFLARATVGGLRSMPLQRCEILRESRCLWSEHELDAISIGSALK